MTAAAASGFGLHRLTDTVAPAAAYTPDYLAEEIVRSRSALEGERKHVTVLFADIVKSTKLIESLDPEEAMKLIDPAVQAMVGAVHRFEGTVNRLQGDGIMALFGAPIAHEHHAVRACYAAVAMQRAVARLPGDDIVIRVGLHTGEVVVRAIQSDLSLAYDATGSVVHVAARMEELAEAGKIRFTDATRREVEGYIDSVDLGLEAMRGISEPQPVFELTGEPVIRNWWQVRAARGLTRLVGREDELALLGEALESARTGNGRVVTVSGLPGIGKSRLVHEFADGLDRNAWTFLEAGAVPEGKVVPYYPIAAQIREWLRVADHDDRQAIGAKLTARIDAVDPELRRQLPALRALLDLEVDAPAWDALDPAERRHAIQTGILALLRAGAAQRPMVLLVEDLHWIDSESQSVLEALGDSLDALPLLLMLTFRPEFEWKGAAKPSRLSIELGRLTRDQAERLLDDLLGTDPTLADLRDRLLERANETPLFLEELVDSLAESGALEGERGSYRTTDRLAQTEVPSSIRSVIASRIDRLAPEDKAVLQTAAVIGKVVAEPVLQEVVGLEEDVLRATLYRLKKARFLEESHLAPDIEHEFRHALTQEVAYESVLRARQRALHAQVVDAIEDLYPDRKDEQIERLAHHAAKAEDWDRAVPYLQMAGAKALERSSWREATNFLEFGLDAITHLDQNADTQRTAIDMRLTLRPAYGATGNVVRMQDSLGEAEKTARALNDWPRLASIKVSQTFALNYLGDLRDAAAAAAEGLGLAKELDDHPLLIAGSFHLGQCLLWSGDYRRTVETMAPFANRLKSDLRDKRIGTAGTTSVLWFGMLGAAHTYLGEFSEGLSYVTDACDIAMEFKRPYDIVISQWYLGFALSHRGEFEEAVPHLEKACEICEAAKIRFLQPVVATSLGYVHAHLDKPDNSRRWLKQAVELSKFTGLTYAVAYATCYRAAASLFMGDYGHAQDYANDALGIIREKGFKGIETLGLRVAGLAALNRGKTESGEAERLIQQARDQAKDLNLRPDLAHGEYALGRYYAKNGDARAARRSFATAIELYDSMGMTHWARRAERAARKVGK